VLTRRWAHTGKKFATSSKRIQETHITIGHIGYPLIGQVHFGKPCS